MFLKLKTRPALILAWTKLRFIDPKSLVSYRQPNATFTASPFGPTAKLPFLSAGEGSNADVTPKGAFKQRMLRFTSGLQGRETTNRTESVINAMATQGKFVCTLPFVHRISQDEFQSKVHEQQEAQ